MCGSMEKSKSRISKATYAYFSQIFYWYEMVLVLKHDIILVLEYSTLKFMNGIILSKGIYVIKPL